MLELGRKIQSQAQDEMTKMQREYFLREQLKAIQKELGEGDEQEAEIQEFESRIAAAGMPEEAEKEARRELDRMRKMPTQAAEYSVIKTYLDWMVSLPWKETTDDNLDIAHARQVLDEDHYGLEEIKERILEFLAVRKLRLERKAETTATRTTGQRGPKIDPPRARGRDPLLCRPARHRQDLAGPVDRPGDGPQVRPPGAGRHPRRGRNPRLPPHLHRLDAGPHHPEPAPGREPQPGLHARRGGQAGPRLPRRSVVGAAGGAGPGAERRVPRSLPGRAVRPEPGVLHHHGQLAGHRSRSRCSTAWRSSSSARYTEEEKVKIAQGYLVPRQIKENGLRRGRDQLRRGRAAADRRASTRARPACATWSAQIGAVCRKVATKVAEKGPASAR